MRLSFRHSRSLVSGAALLALASFASPALAAELAVPDQVTKEAAPADRAGKATAAAPPAIGPADKVIRPGKIRSFAVKKRPARFAKRFIQRAAYAPFPRPRVARTPIVRPLPRYAFLNGNGRLHAAPMLFLGVGF